MKVLLVVLVLMTPLAMAARGGKRRGSGCPSSWPTYHMEYLNAERQPNGPISEDVSSIYSLHTPDADDDMYIPGMQHTFSLQAQENFAAISGFVIMVTPFEEDNCGSGKLLNNERHFRQTPGCGHVLLNKGSLQMRSIAFKWVAPQCGCMKVRATILTHVDKFFVDSDGLDAGPLTRVLCPAQDDEDLINTTLFPLDDEYEVEDVPDVSDVEFYGENEIGPDDSDEEIPYDDEDEEEEYGGLMDGEDDGFNSDLVDEDEDMAGEQRRPGSRRGNWRRQRAEGRVSGGRGPAGRGPARRVPEGRGARGRGPKGRWSGRRSNNRGVTEDSVEEEEEDEDENMESSRRPHQNHRGKHAHRRSKHAHHRHLTNMTQQAREDVLCKRVRAANTDEALGRHLDTVIQNEASNSSRRSWLRRRGELRACCAMETAEDRHGCFEMTRLERINRVCGSEEELPSFIPVDDQKEILEDCCSLEARDTYTCFAESMAEIRRGGNKRPMRVGRASMKMKARRVCRRLEQRDMPRDDVTSVMDQSLLQTFSAIWFSRRAEMRQCCSVEGDDRHECMEDMRVNRYDSVCSGDEPLWLRSLTKPNRTRSVSKIESRCCEMEDEERYACFNNSIVHRMRRSKLFMKRSQQGEMENGVQTDSRPVQSRRIGIRVQKRQEYRRRRVACCNVGRPFANFVESVDSSWSTCNSQAVQNMAEQDSPALTGKIARMCRRAIIKCCKTTAYERLAELAEDYDV